MPQIIFTKKANQDIQRCINFLAKVDASKIQDMLQTILRQISILEKNPLFGPLIEHTNMRKLVIAYGKHGYIALYAYFLTSSPS